MAECHALAGDHQRALRLLASAVERGFHPLAFLVRHDPFLAVLRDQPRFAEIVGEAERRWRAFIV